MSKSSGGRPMATSEVYQVGPDGAGRPELSPEAVRALCQCYHELHVWAAQRRRELEQAGKGAPDGQAS